MSGNYINRKFFEKYNCLQDDNNLCENSGEREEPRRIVPHEENTYFDDPGYNERENIMMQRQEEGRWRNIDPEEQNMPPMPKNGRRENNYADERNMNPKSEWKWRNIDPEEQNMPPMSENSRRDNMPPMQEGKWENMPPMPENGRWENIDADAAIAVSRPPQLPRPPMPPQPPRPPMPPQPSRPPMPPQPPRPPMPPQPPKPPMPPQPPRPPMPPQPPRPPLFPIFPIFPIIPVPPQDNRVIRLSSSIYEQTASLELNYLELSEMARGETHTELQKMAAEMRELSRIAANIYRMLSGRRIPTINESIFDPLPSNYCRALRVTYNRVNNLSDDVNTLQRLVRVPEIDRELAMMSEVLLRHMSLLSRMLIDCLL